MPLALVRGDAQARLSVIGRLPGIAFSDAVAEALAEEAFAATRCTLIVIAHRISSARRAHRILLLDGRSVVVGSHDEVLAASTRYANLVGNWDLAKNIAKVVDAY